MLSIRRTNEYQIPVSNVFFNQTEISLKHNIKIYFWLKKKYLSFKRGQFKVRQKSATSYTVLDIHKFV